jgi:hypothetical protein
MLARPATRKASACRSSLAWKARDAARTAANQPVDPAEKLPRQLLRRHPSELVAQARKRAAERLRDGLPLFKAADEFVDELGTCVPRLIYGVVEADLRRLARIQGVGDARILGGQRLRDLLVFGRQSGDLRLLVELRLDLRSVGELLGCG